MNPFHEPIVKGKFHGQKTTAASISHQGASKFLNAPVSFATIQKTPKKSGSQRYPKKNIVKAHN